MTVGKGTAGFFVALALSLALAIGGVLWLDHGTAAAADNHGAVSAAAAVPDAEACSTTGWYNPGGYFPGDVVYVPTISGVPYMGYPYYWGAWGYPWYPVVTTTAVTIPATAYLPNESQPYLDGTVNNYACNAFDSCVPVSSGEAVICPGNPAGISVNSSSSATCGSSLNIDAKVVGPAGMPVANGTPVLLSSTLGLIPGSTATNDGIASVSLSFPPKTQGTATVTITSGNAKAETKINVTC
jgi:hypothetical protein